MAEDADASGIVRVPKISLAFESFADFGSYRGGGLARLAKVAATFSGFAAH